MLNNPFSSSESRLFPTQELELANLLLETAQKPKDPAIISALCNFAETVLSGIKRPTKKALASSLNATEQTLRDGIANAYLEHGKLVESLGCGGKAEASYRRAEKWGLSRTKGPGPVIPSTISSKNRDIARVPESIFPDDTRPPAVQYALPDADGLFDDTSQLAYCLGLLKITPSPEEALEEAAGNWVKVTTKNPDEMERLKTLATALIRAFTRDELKNVKAIAEVVALAPVLEKDDFRYLLMLFDNGIVQNGLLDVHSLEGLAQLLKDASPGYLISDDLDKILRHLNTRLQGTHSRSPAYIHHLTLAVSNVLDAMADIKFEGLERVNLHESLSAYLSGLLQGSSDPYLVYQAAYAFQALQCVPDDESPWQATMRRAGVVLEGVSVMVSAVKGLDVNGFVKGLTHLQNGLGDVIQVAKIGYEGVSALVEGGQSLFESLKVGLTFNQKRAWYTALRCTDALLQAGQLAKFKTLVCEAPCRHDLSFQLGICQRLGTLAANPLWEDENRQGAVAFLGEIYRNDAAWGQHALVKQWIIQILVQLSSASDSAMSGVESLLLELGSNGDQAKKRLYLECRKQARSSYPLQVALPSPGSPSLLDLVQMKLDVEPDLRRLKKEREAERSNVVYVPPQAKANLQAPDDALFDLTPYVEDFLASDQYKVMLLLGDSGIGKSTFTRALECDLWGRYKKKTGRIPLHINLPAIDKPDQDLITKHLRRNYFNDAQIRELKDHREFILICDGYDESQQMHNLYSTNKLNQPGQWRAQMVISCRSEYLPNEYRDLFQPTDRNLNTASDIFQEAVVAPFSSVQISDYVRQYVAARKPVWRTKDYMEALDKIPNLMDLVKNPFLLTLSLEVLPRMVDLGQDLSATPITRVALYDQFVEQLLEREKKRLSDKSDLSSKARRAFDRLTDEGFTQSGITFLKDLAGAIFKHQAGSPVVDYSPKRDQGTWKGEFFSHDYEKRLLIEVCPLVRHGNQYRFAHRSLLEYCFARAVFEPQEGKKALTSNLKSSRRESVSSMLSFEDQPVPEDEFDDTQEPVVDGPLTWRSFVGEPSILHFLVERVKQEPVFKQQLLAVVEQSKVNKEARKAAANAITVLVRAGIAFNGADLNGIQVPGADLSGGLFDSAQLRGADLRKANLSNVWLHQADLSGARMVGVQFGEWPYLFEEAQILCYASSPDGKTCAVGTNRRELKVHDTSTWTNINTLNLDSAPSKVVFSPSGQQVALGAQNGTVRLWDVQTGAPGPILQGHTRAVATLEYSPSGQQIVSGSIDDTVRLWDVQTGAAGPVLRGHTGDAAGTAFSPSGQQIAYCSQGNTVRICDAQTGAPGPILHGHTNQIWAVAYSPNGQQIVTGSKDRTVRLWDPQTGAPGPVLSGHTSWVLGVVYSPNGRQIASSADQTVRLWDAHTGNPGPILIGHTGPVISMAFSPSGQQIVSGSWDKTVRLWHAQTGAPGAIFSGHTNTVKSVKYSSDGKQISSCGSNTVRLWDSHSSTSTSTLGGHAESVLSVLYSPNGQQVVSISGDGTARLWDAQSGTPGLVLGSRNDLITCFAYAPSGQQLVLGGLETTVRLWDVHAGVAGPTLDGHTDQITCLAFSPCGKQIASGSEDMTVRVWNAQTGTPGPILNGHTVGISTVAYSPNGQQLISCSHNDSIRLWDAQTGAPGPILDNGGSYLNVVFSPSGLQLVSGSWDKEVRLWDMQNSAPGPILSDHTDEVVCVAYSPSGNQIASGSKDMTVRLWDAETGAPGPILSGHTGTIDYMVFSPSGQRIASGSDDNTVRLWDVHSGGCLAVVRGFFGAINSIAWNVTPDGTYFVTGCSDHSVRVWQVLEEDDHCQVRLHWTSNQDRLCMANASIQNVQGLNGTNIRLLEQRGAVGEPTPPLSLRKASKKIFSMASVVSKLKAPSNQSAPDVLPTPMASLPAAPSARVVDSVDIAGL